MRKKEKQGRVKRVHLPLFFILSMLDSTVRQASYLFELFILLEVGSSVARLSGVKGVKPPLKNSWKEFFLLILILLEITRRFKNGLNH